MDIRSINNAAQPAPAPAGQKAVVSEPPVVVKPVAQATVEATPPTQPAPTLAQINQAVNSINLAMKTMSQNLQFSIDEDTDQTIIKIVDQETKEVLRQIPSAEALAIAKALDQAQGLLIKQKA